MAARAPLGAVPSRAGQSRGRRRVLLRRGPAPSPSTSGATGTISTTCDRTARRRGACAIAARTMTQDKWEPLPAGPGMPVRRVLPKREESGQVWRVRVSRGARPPRRSPPRTTSARRPGSECHGLPCLARPSSRQRSERPRTTSEASSDAVMIHGARFDEDRLGGHPGRVLNDERGSGHRPARVPVCLARGSPRQASGAPVALASQAPTSTPPARARLRRTEQTRAGRCRDRGAALYSGKENDVTRRTVEHRCKRSRNTPDGTSTRSRSTSCSRSTLSTSSCGSGDVKAAGRIDRRDEQPPGHDRRASPVASERPSVDATTSRSTSRSEPATRGSANASSASARAGSSAQARTTRRAGAPAGRSGASVGSWRRIACSSSCRSRLGSIPSSSTSALRAWR